MSSERQNGPIAIIRDTTTTTGEGTVDGTAATTLRRKQDLLNVAAGTTSAITGEIRSPHSDAASAASDSRDDNVSLPGLERLNLAGHVPGALAAAGAALAASAAGTGGGAELSRQPGLLGAQTPGPTAETKTAYFGLGTSAEGQPTSAFDAEWRTMWENELRRRMALADEQKRRMDNLDAMRAAVTITPAEAKAAADVSSACSNLSLFLNNFAADSILAYGRTAVSENDVPAKPTQPGRDAIATRLAVAVGSASKAASDLRKALALFSQAAGEVAYGNQLLPMYEVALARELEAEAERKRRAEEKKQKRAADRSQEEKKAAEFLSVLAQAPKPADGASSAKRKAVDELQQSIAKRARLGVVFGRP